VHLSRILRPIAPLAAAAAVLLTPVDVDHHARIALAITVAMIVAWMVECLHPALVGFIGSFLFVAAGGVEFETAFGGFATATPWFLYGALLLFNAADRAGVIERLATHTPRLLARSFRLASVALIMLAYLLAFVIPSSLAKATILALFAAAWARQMPEERRALLTTILVLIAAYGAVSFGHADMPGGPRAIVRWDVAAAMALVAGVLVLARSAPNVDSVVGQSFPKPTLDVRVAAVIAVATGLWITTPIHRTPPELVGLAAGLACWLPGISRADRRQAVGADPLALLVAGTALSIPAVLIETKAVDALSRLWLTTNEFAWMLPRDVVAYWSTTAYRMCSPDEARPALPALDGIASAAGTRATWAYAGSTLLSLHQSPALVLAMSIGGCRARHVLMVGLLVLVAGSAVVMMF